MIISKSLAVLTSVLINTTLLFVRLSHQHPDHSSQTQFLENKILIKLVETKSHNVQIKKKLKGQSTNQKKLTLSMLGISSGRTLIIKKESSLDNGTLTNSYKIGSGVIEIFNKVDERLNYPIELSASNQQGVVKVRIFFDHKGNYQEKNSKFETNNNYLKVHVARILRSAFKAPLKPGSEILGSTYLANTTFYFHLSTGLDPGGENNVSSDQLSFYRHNYGGDTIYDKIHQNTPNLPNLLVTLFKHRPDFLKSEKTKIREYLNSKILEEYKNDPAWEL